MKIDYSKVTTIMFIEQFDNRNVLVGIGMIENKNLKNFADNWEKQEKSKIKMKSYSEPDDFMEVLRKEFENIENELRKK